tara:strand:- start:2541 stop:3350 length:810 start_codon:yes stop_codon:yes gene_type:complete
MYNILLCTDCSENARRAVDSCLYLFKDRSTSYLLLYTYAIEEGGISNLVAYNDELKMEVKKCLELEVTRIRQLPYAKNISITARAVFGKTENVVKRFVSKSDVDLVVVGSQGTNYSSNHVFGSTAKRILFETTTPKLVVPNLATELSAKNQLVLVQTNQLNNQEWWSNITALPQIGGSSYKLILLPYTDTHKTLAEIPLFIRNQFSDIIDLREASTSTINRKISVILESQKPDLLYLNLYDRHLGKQLLSEDYSTSSIFNSTPFFIQPF